MKPVGVVLCVPQRETAFLSHWFASLAVRSRITNWWGVRVSISMTSARKTRSASESGHRGPRGLLTFVVVSLVGPTRVRAASQWVRAAFAANRPHPELLG